MLHTATYAQPIQEWTIYIANHIYKTRYYLCHWQLKLCTPQASLWRVCGPKTTSRHSVLQQDKVSVILDQLPALLAESANITSLKRWPYQNKTKNSITTQQIRVVKNNHYRSQSALLNKAWKVVYRLYWLNK